MSDPTGRTRAPITASGAFAGRSSIFFRGRGAVQPYWDSNHLWVRIEFLQCVIIFKTELATPTSNVRTLALDCYTGPSLGGVHDGDTVSHTFVAGDDDWDLDLSSGTWEITLSQIEEVRDILGAGFPNLSGVTVEDPPYKTDMAFADRLKIGSVLTVSASVAGMSVSASVIVDVARQFTQNDYVLVINMDGENRGEPPNGFGVKNPQILLGSNFAEFSGALNVTDGDHAIAISGGVENAANVSAFNFGSRTFGNAVYSPVREIDIGVRLRAMEDAYSGSVRFLIDKKQTQLADPQTFVDNGTLSIRQRKHSFTGSYYEGALLPDYIANGTRDRATVLSATQPTSDTVDEWCPVRMWIDPVWNSTQAEQPNDLRTLFRYKPFHTFDLTQASEKTVTSTLASGTGATDLTIALPSATTDAALKGTSFIGASLRGYRYLRVRMKASTNETVTVQIGTKEWERDKDGNNLVLTTSYQDFDLDLCSPTNQTASVDDTDTFFPLPTVDGEYWGVNAASSIVIGNISGGVTVDVESIKVVRDVYSRATFLQPFPEQWIPAGDTSEYPVRFLDGDTDGRRSLEGIHFYRPSGGGTPTIRALSDLIGSINGASATYPSDGWVAVAETVFPEGCSNGQDASFAWGSGALYRGGAWSFGFDQDASGSLPVYAQRLYDSWDGTPQWGDGNFYTTGDFDGGPAVLKAAKIFRSQIVGLVFLESSLPAEGVSVSVNGGADGQGITEANGAYQTGLPYPKGGPIADITADVGPAPVPSGAAVMVARRRERMCFRVEPGQAGFLALEVDSPRGWLHAGVGKRIRTFNAMTRSVAFESDEYANVDTWRELCVDSRWGNLVCLGQEGSTYRLYVSEDGGYTGTEKMNVTATSSDLKAFSDPNIVIFLWENGSGVYRQESTDGGATWSSAEAVEFEGVPLDGTILRSTKDPRASSILHLSVAIGGDTKILYSEDYGKTFTLEYS